LKDREGLSDEINRFLGWPLLNKQQCGSRGAFFLNSSLVEDIQAYHYQLTRFEDQGGINLKNTYITNTYILLF